MLSLSHDREHIQDVNTKGRDGKAVSGGLKLISMNSSTVSDQKLRSHLDFAETLQGKKLTVSQDDSTPP